MDIHWCGPAFVQDLEQLFTVDRLIHGLPHFILGPWYRRVELAVRPTEIGVAPGLLILRAKVQPPEPQTNLLRRAPTGNQLITFGDSIVGQVFVDLRELRLTC